MSNLVESSIYAYRRTDAGDVKRQETCGRGVEETSQTDDEDEESR